MKIALLEEKSKQEIKQLSKNNWLEEEKETILIYGPPKCGKTWAYCSYIEKVINNGGNVYIINTDAGVSKTFKQYFGDKTNEIKQKIKYYYVTNMDEVPNIVFEIKTQISEKDLVIIDLLSDFWNMSQMKFINDLSGGDAINFIIKNSRDTKKFGMFEGKMWQSIKAVHNYIVSPFTARVICNVIGVCAQKELEIEKVYTGKIKNKEYEAAGAKPAGEPNLAYNFNTIVYINKQDEGNKHYFQVMGDRGAITTQKMISFDKNFAEKFESERKKIYERGEN